MLNKFLPRRLFAAIALSGFALSSHAVDFTVAYQTTVDPAKVAQADGAYEKASQAKIQAAPPHGTRARKASQANTWRA